MFGDAKINFLRSLNIDGYEEGSLGGGGEMEDCVVEHVVSGEGGDDTI